MKLDEIQKRLLREIADLHTVPEGAYNIRSNSQMAGRRSTANIEITSKTDVSGMDIRIAPFTKNESVHIPVVLTQTGLKEVVYNDFFVGEVAQSCPTLSDPMDCSPLGSSVHGIFQARVLEWGAIAFSICLCYPTYIF